MELIIRGRGQGKTTELIKRCAEEGGYIVVQNQPEAYHISSLARDLGYNIPFPLTAHEFLTGAYYGAGVKKLWIDNADIILQRISTVPIEAITLTEE
jgi:hypothetical protein